MLDQNAMHLARLEHALDLALYHHKGTATSAESVLHSAEMFRLYLDGRVRLASGNTLDVQIVNPVDSAGGSVDNIKDVGAVGGSAPTRRDGDGLSFYKANACGDCPNQIFSGHNSSSSVTAGGEVRDSAATGPGGEATSDGVVSP